MADDLAQPGVANPRLRLSAACHLRRRVRLPQAPNRQAPPPSAYETIRTSVALPVPAQLVALIITG